MPPQESHQDRRQADDRISSLKELFFEVLNERDSKYDQRFGAIDKALKDAAESVKDALTIANANTDKALNSANVTTDKALNSANTAIAAAMAASEKAVLKAESAADKRFDCVSADTPVLCADLIWRPAGNLVPGDELIGVDEESPTRHGRRFRRAVVTHNEIEKDFLLQVTTLYGSVRCNPQHPWLCYPVKTGHRTNYRWVKASDLKPGDKVVRAADLWTPDRSWEAGWLAGMYDGEGCLSFAKQSNKSVRNKEGSETSYLGVHLTLSQRESETSARIKEALENLAVSVCIHRKEPGQQKHKRPYRHPFFHFIVTKRVDVMRILGSIRPPRLLAKAEGFWNGRPINGQHRITEVVSVNNAGTGEIARLGTTTKTFVAGGFVMHNSVNEFRGQLADQQVTFARKTEVDIRFDALEKKLDAAIAQLQTSRGRETGVSAVWAALGVVAAILLSAAGLIVTLMRGS